MTSQDAELILIRNSEQHKFGRCSLRPSPPPPPPPHHHHRHQRCKMNDFCRKRFSWIRFDKLVSCYGFDQTGCGRHLTSIWNLISSSSNSCNSVDNSFKQLFLRCWSVILVIIIILFSDVHAKPVRTRNSSPSNSLIENTVHFLARYGYLPQSDLETGNLRTSDQLREAIKTMQRFGNITATGELDEETKQLMQRKRCGNADFVTSSLSNRVKRYALQGIKWEKIDLTWSVGSYTTSLSRDTVREELSRALSIWSDASKLSFREVMGDDADIIVSFYRRFHGDGYAFDGQGAVLAHAFFPGDGRGGDTHFDDDEHWIAGMYNSDDGVSLLSVAAHEFGHSLGLSHSSVPDALMFPYYQGLKANFKLPYDDMMGIQQLYGAREERPWATLNPDYATHPPRVPSTSTESPQPVTTMAPRRKPQPSPPPTEYPVTDKPDTCDTSYDAISVIRHEIFIFKGRYFWRLDDRGLRENYPVEIERFWYNLPHNMTHIDALYERVGDKKIVFFIGKQFWVFNANQPLPGYPKPLTDLGLPEEIEKIDAAMVWGHNSKTYFFSGTMYWRFDEAEQLVELDYPRDMSMWNGVDYNIDAAFQWTNGHTYFFKGKAFWRFNDKLMRVENVAPILSGPFWMGCPDKSVDPNVPEEGRKRLRNANKKLKSITDESGGGTSAFRNGYNFYVFFLVAILASSLHF